MPSNQYNSSYTGTNHDTYVTKSQLVDLIYPVESIYISLNNTNPTALFGGSWEAVQDRFLLGAGNNYNGNATGGEATHTLTQAETPAHTHTRGTMEITGSLNGGDCSFGTYNCGGSGAFYTNGSHPAYMFARTTWATYGPGYAGISFAASRTWSGSTSSIGGNGAHNNMPPYLVVYMWKRVA